MVQIKALEHQIEINAIKNKFTKAALGMYLDPSTAREEECRHIHGDDHVKPCCPLFARGIQEYVTVDVGNHQSSAVLVIPHIASPILLSHSALPNVVGVLFNGMSRDSSRLVEDVKGFYAGGGVSSPSVNMPYYRSFEMPSYVDFALNASIGVPVHGCFYVPQTASGLTGPRPQTSVMFRDFTEFLDVNGNDTGLRVFPVSGEATTSDIIDCLITYRKGASNWVDGDLSLRVTSVASTGVQTQTSTNFLSVTTGRVGVCGAAVTLPAGAIGVVSVEIVALAANSFNLSQVRVSHIVGLDNATISPQVGLGSFVGNQLAMTPALIPLCQSARVTALSCLITNTASSLNANGFISATAFTDSTLGSCGVYGENGVASLTGTRTFKFIDGSYMALAPSASLEYRALDSLPSLGQGGGVFYVRTQDATPISFKIEYNAVIEVMSQSTLFPTRSALEDEELMQVLRAISGAQGYLVLSSNDSHWDVVRNGLASAMKYAAKLGREAAPRVTNPGVQTGLALGSSLLDDLAKKTATKQKITPGKESKLSKASKEVARAALKAAASR